MMNILLRQKTEDVIILTDDRVGISIGEKRNALLSNGVKFANYVAFIDDDDTVSDDYVEQLMKGINKGVDCCSLRGVIDERGEFNIFEHSIRYDEYATVNPDHHGGVKYLRYPNHCNAIRSDIAGQFRFPEINHGEDTDWATQIHRSGQLMIEHYIPEPIYFYDPSSNRK